MRIRPLSRAAVLLAAAALHVAAVGQDDFVDRPVLAAGDRWVYRVVDGFTGLETRQYGLSIVAATWPRPTVSFGPSVRDGQRLPPPYGDTGEPWSWPPSGLRTESGTYDLVEFPLRVGKEWSMQFEVFWRGGGEGVAQLRPDRRKATVEAWESIRVPAGEFRVLRVVHVGRRRMHRRDGEFDVPVRETVWYSPDVKNFVKREIRWLESGRAA
jgi:hypothetical protein